MIVNQEIKEHRIQPSMSACLKGKRVAERESKSHIQYQCIKSLAETEMQNMMSNTVNIERLQKDVEKILSDIEKLKDKQRTFANGGHQ